MLDEYGFEIEREYVVNVSDIDVSTYSDDVYVGTVCMTNGKKTFEVDFEHDTKSGKNDYSYYEKDVMGRYQEPKLPLEVVQSLEVFDACVERKVDEYIRENKHDRHRGFER
jgi:hypothetical protein